MEFLSEVLRSYRTTIQTPIGETPFYLAFGSEVVILVKIDSVSLRVKHYNPRMKEEGMKLSLALLQEKRDDAQAMMATYQQKIARYFNEKVMPRLFKLGDWVLQKVSIAT